MLTVNYMLSCMKLCLVCGIVMISTHWSHQTSRVEFFLAGAAPLLGQRVVGAVDDREADHAVFYPLEALIHVVLPQSQALHYTAILNTHTHTHIFMICFLFPEESSWPVLLKRTSLVET